jgi:hypothetical protein
MRLLSAAALIALIAPLPAAAQDWYRVGPRDDGAQYVDLASIRSDGAWLRANGMMIFTPESGDTGPVRAMTIAQFDCKAGSIHFVRFEAYSQAGKLLEASDNPEEGFTPAKKGTPFGDAVDFVCNRDRSQSERVADPLKKEGMK